jgi:hypothetical protein
MARPTENVLDLEAIFVRVAAKQRLCDLLGIFLSVGANIAARGRRLLAIRAVAGDGRAGQRRNASRAITNLVRFAAKQRLCDLLGVSLSVGANIAARGRRLLAIRAVAGNGRLGQRRIASRAINLAVACGLWVFHE